MMGLRWPAGDGVVPEGVRLLDADPDLGLGLRKAELVRARELVVPGLRASRGLWPPPERLRTAMGVLVLDGILTATGCTFARDDVRLLGPGDTIAAATLTDRDVAWRVLEPVFLAVLDQRFVSAVQQWPALLTGLTRRLFESQREEHIHAAICAMPRVEERILALLCHLALRWGRVTLDGVTLTLPVTHESLGALIGARRPTVSLALVALTQQELIRRREDGTWLLPPDCREWPTTGIPRARPRLAA
jgi:CRP/FNR family transcriptional regulator, cyclic AMP receptor protein